MVFSSARFPWSPVAKGGEGTLVMPAPNRQEIKPLAKLLAGMPRPLSLRYDCDQLRLGNCEPSRNTLACRLYAYFQMR